MNPSTSLLEARNNVASARSSKRIAFPETFRSLVGRVRAM